MTRLSTVRRSALSLYEPEPRPKTRAECKDGPRPCPYLGCRHHLYSDEHDTGRQPRFNVEAMERDRPSCSLDVADDGNARDVDEISKLTGLWHTNVEAALESAMQKLEADPLLFEQYVAMESRTHVHPLAAAAMLADPASDDEE